MQLHVSYYRITVAWTAVFCVHYIDIEYKTSSLNHTVSFILNYLSHVGLKALPTKLSRRSNSVFVSFHSQKQK